MQKNFKLILSILVVLLSGALAFGQEESEKVEYKDVTLDGKPAKLNVVTGEITFVNPNDKKKPVKFDDYVAQSNKKAKAITTSNSVSSSTSTSISDSSSNSSSLATIHTVKEGETLLKIAIRYGASLTELKRANNMETTLVRKGQKLRVSHFDAVGTQSQVVSQQTYEANVSGAEVHIVEKGQTLYSLARRYGLTVSELKQYNGLNSNLIKVGQKLSLPKTNAEIETENSNETITSWRVVDGDTLYSISKYTGTSVDELKRINGLDNNIIIVGQQIDFKSKSATAKK